MQTYRAAVITVSDKGARGERTDTSGPAVRRMLEEAGYAVVHTAIIPDDRKRIREELIRCADILDLRLIITTGGTGFSQRDVTPEASLDVIERPAPGLPEAMRAESMRITPHGCLSRGTAGLRGKSLIINLPGSRKAAVENLSVVLKPVRHGIEMLLSEGSSDCAGSGHAESHEAPAEEAPSLDAWIREAKAAEGACGAGMYLTHCGVVRATSRAAVRDGDASAGEVKGMMLSYDPAVLEELIREAAGMEGVFHVRAWIGQGKLKVGDDIMRVLIGADTRPHAFEALTRLTSRIKKECVTEEELF